ncbi:MULTISPECIES: DUF5692 family protein [Cryobacterium]|uniref:Uncharacterized protein n=1 Tax=Cryobacterium zongtaii TaxID=1259217 RepID=A0A2S3ZFY2_9MICO|nr:MULTISPECIES: DUF5692 family protein [Cryobacterium]ASD23449.1 hypothetical protein B7495_16135 [Cryobacterium sp. LW097]POH65953.1 hypothetical protein C3B61_09710 [Cryobacterium zongtaii]POH70527.1 hypothetical protein C3B60_00890 [Cryobacterium zongtaii]TFC47360.1 hypothetical protein E3O57_04930 [Cryobacterium sp. TMN-39-2]TFC53033.1 hypothetical protein E3O68_12765 [Cryobacterium sp. TMB3-1-2]
MFLYESIPWYSTLMWVAVVAGLMLANEIARASKWAALVLFIGLPVVLTIFVWPHTAGADSSTGTWFHWVKVYSALAGCLGFMAIRFIPKLAKNKYWLMFPAAILALNIFEAVIRDFQVYGMQGMVDGVFMVGGPWNIMNGIAGLLNLVTICGWAGIIISRGKKKDMIWPDMLWFWIIAYDLWNFAYVYNAVGDHSFYAGAALLISCTIPAFFIKRGAWLQHRAQTLAFWMMFTMAVPTFVTSSKFAVESSHNPTALFIVSAISLAANIAVVVYQVRVIVRTKRNPLKDELFVELPAYQKVLADNRPLDAAPAVTGSPRAAASV